MKLRQYNRPTFLTHYYLSQSIYRKVLKIHDADASKAGTYSCQAGKNGKTDSANFQVEVKIPVVPRVKAIPTKSLVSCKEGKRGCKINFKVTTKDGSVSILQSDSSYLEPGRFCHFILI